jgi:hypothetical protein
VLQTDGIYARFPNDARHIPDQIVQTLSFGFRALKQACAFPLCSSLSCSGEHQTDD